MSPPHFPVHPPARGWSRSGATEAGGAHPVKVTRVAILALRRETAADRRQFPHEEERGGQQRGQQAIGPGQPSRKPRHRVHQGDQRREDSHLPGRVPRRLRPAPGSTRLLLGGRAEATPPDPDVNVLLDAAIN